MSNTIPPLPSIPDEFQIELARLAGLEPAQVVAGSMTVEIDRGEGGGTEAVLTASVHLDPHEVIKLAMKHKRLGLASSL